MFISPHTHWFVDYITIFGIVIYYVAISVVPNVVFGYVNPFTTYEALPVLCHYTTRMIVPVSASVNTI